ncbi:hypothetical protein MACH10_20530 [Thalassospira tepidiphila]|uniref:acetyltransferase n=1 Tax=Thalassospira tepidiphila TaxID=393657 RepID=UPI0029217D78|nr:hypothetical protein MACH10_20530 [Thalassospira tepidiphila]
MAQLAKPNPNNSSADAMMDPPCDVVIFGTGEMAEVARFYLQWEGTHNIVAHTLNREYLNETSKDGLPVVAWEDLNTLYPPDQVKLFCPVSYKEVNLHRKRLFLEGLDKGYDFIRFIHPYARYYGTPVGRNTFIFEDNVIQPHTVIGDNCILWSGNHIGHHTTIRDHCFIASHVVVSGAVDIGERCFLGVNSTIRDNISLGEGCVVGAGALVTRALDDLTIIVGAKSRIMPKTSDQLDGI